MTTMQKRINEAIHLTKQAEYLEALTLFLDIYGSEEAPPVQERDCRGFAVHPPSPERARPSAEPPVRLAACPPPAG